MKATIVHAIALGALCASGLALAQDYAALPRDTASSEPLREVPANVRSQPLADGQVTH